MFQALLRKGKTSSWNRTRRRARGTLGKCRAEKVSVFKGKIRRGERSKLGG